LQNIGASGEQSLEATRPRMLRLSLIRHALTGASLHGLMAQPERDHNAFHAVSGVAEWSEVLVFEFAFARADATIRCVKCYA